MRNKIRHKASRRPTPIMDKMRKRMAHLQLKAIKKGIPFEELAEQQLQPHHGLLRKLIHKRGVRPSESENLAEDAAKYELSKQQEIADRQAEQQEVYQNQGMAEDEAAMLIDSPEEVEENIAMEDAEEFGEGYDNFLDDILTVAKVVGKKALDLAKKAKAKKKAKGDKTPTNSEDVAAVAAESVVGKQNKSALDLVAQAAASKNPLIAEAGQMAQNQISDIEKQKKKEFIHDNMGWIILAVLVVLAIGFTIAVATNKKS